jgi:ABC-type Mn2+/Zn2+ transport system permease subunit
MFENLKLFHEALEVGLLVCLFGAIAGAQVVQRRIIFVGVALSQLAAAGVAFGLLFGLNESLGAAILTLCGVLLISLFGSSKRLGEGGLLGVIYAAGGALLILFLARAGHESEVSEILFGNITAVTHAVAHQTFWLLPAVLFFFLLFHKELALFSFDPEMARAMGYRMAWWNFLFYAALGLGLATAIKAGGLLFLFGTLILPVLAALQLASRNRWIVPLAFLISAGSFVAALLISIEKDFPTGALTVAFQTAILLLAIGAAKLLRRHD